MAIIIHFQQDSNNLKIHSKTYLPKGFLLSRADMIQAQNLDEELQVGVERINQQYHQFKRQSKMDPTTKWLWLGQQMNTLLDNLKHKTETDIETNLIWLAINQYLDDDLRKDNQPANRHFTKRSWLFAKGPHKWLPNWSSWLSLTDRGEQLMANPILLKELEKKLKDKKLTSTDYKVIAKLIAQEFPSHNAKSANLEFMDESAIKNKVNKITRSLNKD